ncbi:kinase-like protein [Hesseltinella vesiculosa]|uniref:Kinase-like protein n=1 Tax=Hesseltinella vesiculosa TaxID=101127 RepID=A0A1X2GQA4_9FUNG|nr:kinase-like protein [Hesseltinella vesiculosa]
MDTAWSQPPLALLKRYHLGNELGKGGHGFALSAVDRLTGQHCAVKFIYKSKIPITGWVTLCLQEGSAPAVLDCVHVPMEIYVLQQIQHPNVIKLLNVYQDDYFYYLVTEAHGINWSSGTHHHYHSPVMPPAPADHPPIPTQSPSPPIEILPPPPPVLKKEGAHDLFECIEHHGHFSEALSKHVFTQILDALLHLKSRNIYHRDIKDENILIDDHFQVKLIDFGSAVGVQRNKQTWLSQFHGTLSFAAPEILKGLLYEPEPAEAWSLGVLLYTMLYGQVPFSNPLQVIHGQCHTSSIDSSKSCLHLINSLFRKYPKHRPTLEKIRAHPWLGP